MSCEAVCGPHFDDMVESPVVPPDEFIRHVRTMMRNGLTVEQIGEKLGVIHHWITSILEGRNTRVTATHTAGASVFANLHLRSLDLTYAVAA